MLTNQQTKLVIELIQSVITCEKSLEIIRCDLNDEPLFSMKPIFLRFDQNRQGFIDTEDLLSFCQDNDIQISSKEAYYLLKWLDKNIDGKVTFDDLTKALLPRDSTRKRTVTVLREPYFITKNMYLPQVIEKGIAAYLSELLSFIQIQQDLKYQLLKQSEFNVFNVYRQIDAKNEGHINENNFGAYLTAISDEFDQQDVKYFFWVADLNDDGKISCQEFIEVLMNADTTGTTSISQSRSTLQLTRTPEPQRQKQKSPYQHIYTPEKSARKSPYQSQKIMSNSQYVTYQAEPKVYSQVYKPLEREKAQLQNENRTRSSYKVSNRYPEQEIQQQSHRNANTNNNPPIDNKNKQSVIHQSNTLQSSKTKNFYQQPSQINESVTNRSYQQKSIQQNESTYRRPDESRRPEQFRQPEESSQPDQLNGSAYRMVETLQSFESPVKSKQPSQQQQSKHQYSKSYGNMQSIAKSPYKGVMETYLENHYTTKRPHAYSPSKQEASGDSIYVQETYEYQQKPQLTQIQPQKVITKQSPQFQQPQQSYSLFNTPEKSTIKKQQVFNSEASARRVQQTPESKFEQNNDEYLNYIQSIRKPEVTAKPVPKMAESRQTNQNENGDLQELFPFFKYLLKQVLLLREIEEAKRQLALRQDFNLMDAFRIFDNRGSGEVNLNDLITGFQQLEIKVSQKDLALLMQQYAKQKNCLKYSEFTKMILPHTPDYSILLSNRTPTYEQIESLQDIFSATTIQYYKDLLDIIIKCESTVQQYRQTVPQDKKLLFRTLDQEDKGYLEETDFRNFFALFDTHPTAMELRRLVSRYNGNIYGDGQVQEQNFII